MFDFDRYEWRYGWPDRRSKSVWSLIRIFAGNRFGLVCGPELGPKGSSRTIIRTTNQVKVFGQAAHGMNSLITLTAFP